MQVELYVQDDYHELSQLEPVHNETDAQIAAETWKNWFERWLEILQPSVPPAPCYEIGLCLTNDAEIQTFNSQYRQQNKPTDVLSFASLEGDFPQLAEMDAEEALYLGDIVISIETALRQAQQQQHSLLTELTWLAAHGLLHLLGWDHPDEESLSRMLNKQVVLLKSIGIEIDWE